MVRCRCRQVFNVLFDFRRHYRKRVSLAGTYEITSQGGIDGGIIHIHNISKGGLGFTVSGLHRIMKDQELQLEFQLNDKKKRHQKTGSGQIRAAKLHWLSIHG